jgi:hypothetical protein
VRALEFVGQYLRTLSDQGTPTTKPVLPTRQAVLALDTAIYDSWRIALVKKVC